MIDEKRARGGEGEDWGCHWEREGEDVGEDDRTGNGSGHNDPRRVKGQASR